MPKLEDTMECYKDCPRENQFVRLVTENIKFDEVDKFYRFLQGEVPPELRNMKRPPRLSKDQAFKVIYYLQEVMGLLPDHFEQCKTCKELFDSRNEGNTKTFHCDFC